jgi:hypothetical protein
MVVVVFKSGSVPVASLSLRGTLIQGRRVSFRSCHDVARDLRGGWIQTGAETRCGGWQDASGGERRRCETGWDVMYALVVICLLL